MARRSRRWSASKETTLAVWKRLTEALHVAGANVGERRTTPASPEQLSGVVEHVLQDAKVRVITLRLDAPRPGVAMVGTYNAGPAVMTSVSVYFYGDDAAAVAEASEAKWRSWLTATSTAKSSA